MLKFITLLSFTLLLISPSVSWWCTGHQLVAQVAYSDLLKMGKLKLNAIIIS